MKHTRMKWLKVTVVVFIFYAAQASVFKGDYSSLLSLLDQQEPIGLTIQLDQFAPPNTNPVAQPDFDIWAWNSFIALNWPAVVPSADNGYLRGIPDTNKSFGAAASNDLLVWETFKEKREIFNQVIPGTDTATLNPWNSPVDYGPLRQANTDIDENPFGSSVSYTTQKVLHQSNKQGISYNAFDETAEVGSEALELFNTEGDFNPILGKPVGPRVWKGKPSDMKPVLYEVKLNYDYYDYVSKNGLYLDSAQKIAKQASLADLRLPYRTSSEAGPKGQKAGPNYPLATSYSTDAVNQQYKNINAYPDGSSQTPPFVGSMQFKAAWVRLDSATDDIGSFHTSMATYYVTENDKPVAKQGLFGLIGLHIIQRIHQTNSEIDSNPKGGTFIFATWEHTSLRELDAEGYSDYTYSNYYNPAVDPAADSVNGQPVNPMGFYPKINVTKPYDGVYRVKPKFNIISNPGKDKAPGTKEVNDAVHQMLPEGSVWKNYQLVGTQFMAIDVNSSSILEAAGKTPRYPVTTNDPQGIGLPVYLANLVIETNEGLQFFQGQPPGTIPIDNYAGAGVGVNNTVKFARDNANTSFNRQPYNMGGCMGCHGVAQSKGFSFSFVLLGGRGGALTDTESHFEIPPLEPVDDNKKP